MADPKNKWNQPAAPPPPMFFGKKERDLVKQVNDELAERVIGQTIAYYPISMEESNFNETYGEAIEKVSLPPVRVYAYVEVSNEQTNELFGYEYQSKLTVNFHRKRLTEDQNLFVRVGDFVQYGEIFYEIVKLYNDTRYYFGQVEHKFQVSAECVRAREGSFRVIPAVDRPSEVTRDQSEATSPAPRSAPYPPLTATYVTVKAEAKLPNERVLTAGTGITLDDGGANSTLTIAASGQNAIGPTGSLQFQTGGGNFSGSANLTFLSASNRLGIATDTPTHNLTIIGNMSASSDVFIGGDLSVQGVVVGGSPLQVSGTLEIVDGAGTVIATLGSSSLGPNVISASLGIINTLSASTLVSASYFYGDGSNLTGVTASAVAVADGPVGSLQFREDASGEVSGSANLQFLTSSNLLQLTGTAGIQGSLSASANISASAFYGDGSNLTSLPSAGHAWSGATVGGIVTYLNATTASVQSNLTFDGSTLVVTGALSASSNISASAVWVGGDLSVCAGTASIAHLSGCSDITVYSPLFMTGAYGTKLVQFGSSNTYISLNEDDGDEFTTLAHENGLLYLTASIGIVLVAGAYGDDAGVIIEDGTDLVVGDVDGDHIVIYNDGNVSSSQNISASSLYVADSIVRAGDADTYIDFTTADEITFQVGNKQLLKLDEGTTDEVIVGNASEDTNFRVATSGFGNNFLVKGTNAGGVNNSVGIREQSPQAVLHVSGTTEQLFLVEGETGNVLVVSGSGRVGIGTDEPDYALDVAGDAGFNEYIYHNGDANTYIQFGVDQINLVAGAVEMIYINEGGLGHQADKVAINNDQADVDFQVKGLSKENLFRTDAATNRVGIGMQTPSASLHVSSSGDAALFRVDGATSGSILFVTGSGRVGIGTETPGAALEIECGDLHLNGEAGSTNPEIQLIGNGGIGIEGLRIRYNNGTGNSHFENTYNHADRGIHFTTRGQYGSGDDALSLVAGSASIGTTSPNALLHVSSSGDAALFRVDGATAGNVLFVTGSGRVGIGTTSPDHELTVAGNISATNISASSNVSASVVHVYNQIHHAQSVEKTGSFTIGEPMAPLYRVNTSSSVVTASLPSLVGALEGLCLNIKDVGLSASTNNVVIAPNGSDTIDGATSLKIQANGGSVGLQADPDSAEWYIVFTN